MSKAGIFLIIAGLMGTFLIITMGMGGVLSRLDSAPMDEIAWFLFFLMIPLAVFIAGVWLVSESSRKEEKEKTRDEEIEKLRLDIQRLQKNEKCPHCGELVPKNTNFCPNCGKERK